MSVIMIGLASCGGNDGHSKAFKESKKILDNVTESIQKSKTCDELDMAAFGMLGMLGVEGIEAMPQSEQDELSKISDEMTKIMEKKREELNCQDSFFSDDDDDSAFDSLFEDEEE